MPSLIIRMSHDQHARLETFRASNGLRSLNAAMLALIDESGGAGLVPAEPAPSPKPSFSHGRSKTVVAPAKRATPEAVTKPERFTMDDVRPKFTPRFKKGKS